MLLNLKVQRKNLKDLLAIAEIDDSLLSKAVDILNSTKPPFVKPSEVEDALDDIGLSDSSESLVRQLISLSALAREKDITAEDTVNSVLAALDKVDEDQDYLKCYKLLTGKSKHLQELLDSSSIINVMKAIELSFDFDRFLDKARVITDFRPVYSQSETVEINSWVVTQTLKINYTESNTSKSVSIAVDERDLEIIIEKCQRALEKSKELKRFAANNKLGNIIVAGEEKLK